MTREPTIEHLRAVERALTARRGFRQAFDDASFADDPTPADAEWTPLQREILTEIARAALNAA